jgi:hypothetical protein
MSAEFSEDRRRSHDDGGWRLDKTISLPNVFILVCQVVVITFFFAEMRDSVTDHGSRIISLEEFNSKTINGNNGMMERLTRLEEKQSNVQHSLDRIELKIDSTTSSPSGTGAHR